MLWITVGLFAVGAGCGASIRLLLFICILLAGTIIAGIAMASQGLGAALWFMLLTVIALQVGYVAGLILRAAGRSLYAGISARAAGKAPVNAPLGQKRR
jgi:uncharacterized protein (DUF58 family)